MKYGWGLLLVGATMLMAGQAAAASPVLIQSFELTTEATASSLASDTAAGRANASASRFQRSRETASYGPSFGGASLLTSAQSGDDGKAGASSNSTTSFWGYTSGDRWTMAFAGNLVAWSISTDGLSYATAGHRVRTFFSVTQDTVLDVTYLSLPGEFQSGLDFLTISSADQISPIFRSTVADFANAGGRNVVLRPDVAYNIALTDPNSEETLSRSTAALVTGVDASAIKYERRINLAFSAAGTNAAVPEPATWTMLILGFGVVGAVLRRRTPATSFGVVA